jgi:hypothetical protein
MNDALLLKGESGGGCRTVGVGRRSGLQLGIVARKRVVEYGKGPKMIEALEGADYQI